MNGGRLGYGRVGPGRLRRTKPSSADGELEIRVWAGWRVKQVQHGRRRDKGLLRLPYLSGKLP